MLVRVRFFVNFFIDNLHNESTQCKMGGNDEYTTRDLALLQNSVKIHGHAYSINLRQMYHYYFTMMMYHYYYWFPKGKILPMK